MHTHTSLPMLSKMMGENEIDILSSCYYLVSTCDFLKIYFYRYYYYSLLFYEILLCISQLCKYLVIIIPKTLPSCVTSARNITSKVKSLRLAS